MAVYIDSLSGLWLRWSRAVFGKHYDSKSGSRTYVCHTCSTLVPQMGGSIRPPF